MRWLTDRVLAFLWKHQIRGCARLHHALRGRGPLSIRTQHGLRVKLDPREYIDACVIREGYYESEVLEAILDAVGPGAVLWDVGANWGLHSLTVKLLRPAVTVVSFEPNPPLARLLLNAAAANRLDIQVEQLALGPQHDNAVLYLQPGNAGMSSLVNWGGARRPAGETVCVERGDELVRTGRVPAPTAIKMDVEGYEADVLAGLGETLDRESLHTVVFEDNRTAETPSKKLLAAKGFQIETLRRHEHTEHNLDNYVARR